MTRRWTSLLLPLALLTGCAADGAASSDASGYAPQGATPGGPGATGISQTGAQDFGLFRQIIDRGEVPGPETLDARGFFAEHKLDYPAADCGNDVCMHGLVGAMGNMITGGRCTMLQIGLNSPLDPATLPRPPMHLVLSVDVSGSMLGAPMTYLREGLQRMLDQLGPSDRVSLVAFSDQARVVLEGQPVAQRAPIEAAIDTLQASGSTNLYDGLATALRLADEQRLAGEQPRVIFASDGEATTGLTTGAKIVGLAEAYAREGIPLSSIGVGQSFDVGLMRGLGDVGAGNFYFLEDPAAVAEVFSEEAATFLHPVALDVRIEASPASLYSLRTVHGAARWQGDESGATITIPSLFLASRTSAAAPIEGGRRGGGGAMLVELVPRGQVAAGPVGKLTMTWRQPGSGEEVTQVVDLGSPHSTQDLPAEGYFTSFTSEKGFVMLNVLVGFQIAADRSHDGDPLGAVATLDPLIGSVTAWLARHADPDPDITDDLRYLRRLRTNLAELPAVRTLPPEIVPPPQEPWPSGD